MTWMKVNLKYLNNMNELKFTPGPWTANFSPTGLFSVMKLWPSKEHPDNPQLVDVQTICPIRPFAELTDYDQANGNLMAAAPDMFEIVKELYEWSIKAKTKGAIFPKLEAVYKKVMGE